MKTMIKVLLFSLSLISLVMLPGCGDVDQANTEAPVWLEVQESLYTSPDNMVVNSEIALIDVCDSFEEDGLFYCSYFDELVVTKFTVHPVNPDFEERDSTPYLDVHIFHYRVTFNRDDGGTDNPGRFDITCDLYCPFEEETNHEIKILHAHQKLDPPLIWLNCLESFCYDLETGEVLINGHISIQFWGKTNAGKNVYAKTEIPVQFADWGD